MGGIEDDHLLYGEEQDIDTNGVQPHEGSVSKTPRSWVGRAQRFPTRISRKIPDPLKWVSAAAIIGIWLMISVLLNNRSLFAEPTVNGKPAEVISCGETVGGWQRPNENCGINGQGCLAGKTNTTFTFRCPANCIHDGRTFQKTHVGSYMAERELLVIGGNNVYRADSTLCAAAIHHGAISTRNGGCATIRMKGSHSGFTSVHQNTITSIPFNSSFFGSFEFINTGTCNGCTDRRLAIAIISLFGLLVTGYLFTSPALFLFSQATIGFWTLYFSVDSPSKAGTAALNAELISTGFQRFLPAMMGVFVIYHVATRPQLKNMHANLTRALFWCIPFYIGILENYTFAMLPIDRMLVSDFNSQAGGWLTVIVLGGIVLAIAANQAWEIWRRGDLKRMVLVYTGIALTLLIISRVPNETLRIHHYIIGLILIPGTYLQTTPSLVYQGLCTGLFVSGVGRWGFASILETSSHVQRNANEDPTIVRFIPAVTTKSPNGGLSKIVLAWEAEPRKRSQEYTLTINDLEAWRGTKRTFNLTKWVEENVEAPRPASFYVRVAPVDHGEVGRYTSTAMVDIYEGSWLPSPEGLI